MSYFMKKVFLALLFSFPMLSFAQGTMDFENVVLPTAYKDSSCVSNGITYTYKESRDQDTFPITNKGLMLRKASVSYVEWTIPNGVGDLSFQFMKAYTGSSERQLEIYVNGVSVDTTVAFGSGTGTQTMVYNHTSAINLAGAVTIKIKNVGATTGNKQSIIDNISWTAFSTCGDVSNLSVTNPVGSDVMLTWTAASPVPGDGYGIVVYDDNNTPIDTIYTHNNLYYYSNNLPDDNYTFTVFSLCDTTSGNISNGVSGNVIIVTPVNSCPDVTNLQVVDNGDGTMTATWTAPANAPADGYGVLIVPSNTTPNLDNATIVTATSMVSDSMATGTYDVYVFSACDLTNDVTSTEVKKTVTLTNTVGLGKLAIISSIYPNPAKTHVTVVTAVTNGEIELINITGQVVKIISVSSANTTIDVAGLPSGMYQLIFTAKEGKMITKLLKE